jgi:hypothetical protein
MEVPMIKFMLFRRTTIPTSAMPAANSLPNLNPFASTQRWLETAATLIVLSQGTTMIDRLMAEDFAEAFQIAVEEIPETIEEMLDFVRDYIVQHLANGSSVSELTQRLEYAVQKLNQIVTGQDE